MIRIVSSEDKILHRNRRICSNCGCNFLFDDSDIVKPIIIPTAKNMLTDPREFVFCPNCGMYNMIEGIIDSEVLKNIYLWYEYSPCKKCKLGAYDICTDDCPLKPAKLLYKNILKMQKDRDRLMKEKFETMES